MTITLPPDLERSLEEEARKRGTTLEQFVVDDLRKRYDRSVSESGPAATAEATEGTMLDFLEGYIGIVDGPAEALSEDTGRKFTEIVEEKHRRISERVEREGRSRP